MNKTLQWILPTIAVLAVGPLAAWPVAGLRDTNGSPEATLLVTAQPLVGVLALVLLVALAGVGGAVTARLTLPGTGRTFAGLCAAWAAMLTGASWQILMVRGSSAVVPLVIEGVLVAVAATVIVAMLAVGGGSHSPAELRDDLKKALVGPSAWLGIAIGVVGGGVGAFLVAVEGGRGQCLIAGVAGGVLAAVGVQLADSQATPEQARLRATAAVLLLMVLGPLSLAFHPGMGEISAAARTGTLMGPGLVQPLDWLVGVLLGVPTGLAWVGSVAERATESAKTARA
jgi:hypothetical protein